MFQIRLSSIEELDGNGAPIRRFEIGHLPKDDCSSSNFHASETSAFTTSHAQDDFRMSTRFTLPTETQVFSAR